MTTNFINNNFIPSFPNPGTKKVNNGNLIQLIYSIGNAILARQSRLIIDRRDVAYTQKAWTGIKKTSSQIVGMGLVGAAAGLALTTLGIGIAVGSVIVDKLTPFGKHLPMEANYGLLKESAGIAKFLCLGILSDFRWTSELPQINYSKSLGSWSFKIGVLGAACYAMRNIARAVRTEHIPAAKPILNQELMSDIDDLVRATYSLQQEGGYFQHLLLYGPSGTGKTMLSKWIAEHSKMNYLMMTGGDLAQFVKKGSHVTEFNKLFADAKREDTPTIIFIDEADIICGKRESNQEMGEILNAFLKHTGEGTKKFMIILATNRLEVIDPAVLNRMDYKLFIGLPQLQERKQMLVQFATQFFDEKERNQFFHDAALNELSRMTDGLPGRSLFKLMNHLGSFKRSPLGLTQKALDSSIKRFIEREKRLEQERAAK